MTDLPAALREAADALQEQAKYPHGSPVFNDYRTAAGKACVRLCGNDQDKGRTLWKLIVTELGYMPVAAAAALIRAANVGNLVPDIPEPDLDGPR